MSTWLFQQQGEIAKCLAAEKTEFGSLAPDYAIGPLDNATKTMRVVYRKLCPSAKEPWQVV